MLVRTIGYNSNNTTNALSDEQLNLEDRQKVVNNLKESSLKRKRLREPKKIAKREALPIAENETDLCVSVWQSVVLQAFYDLANAATTHEQKLDRAQTVAWFGQGVAKCSADAPTDFEIVCELARLDPFAIAKLANKIIKGEDVKIDGLNFRTLRRDASNRAPKKNKKRRANGLFN